jgi:hypothetical protein
MLLAAGLPASASADQQLADGGGPQIGFAEQAAGGDAARGLLSGQIADFNGVQSLWVAVRASRRTKSGWCRWWMPRLGRLSSTGSACQVPEWMPAQIARTDSGFAWKVRLGGHPRSGHYVVVFRAVDLNGNVQRTLPDGRRRVGIQVGS